MSNTNDFVPFCPTDTGSNLLSESDYIASADRVSGNKTGIASSMLNNRALRQANAVASQFAQYISNATATDVLDDANAAKMLSQITASLMVIAPVLTRYTSSFGTHQPSYYFFIASGSASATATYTNNTVTFTVVSTIAAGTFLHCVGSAAPTTSGTLTKSGGTGDAALTFYAVRAPLYLEVDLVGGGGGSGGSAPSGSSAGNGTAGSSSSFDTSNLVGAAGGGGGGSGNASAVGGAVTITSPWITLIASPGQTGGYPTNATSGVNGIGGFGGSNLLGFGAVTNSNTPGVGVNAAANSGCGASGATINDVSTSNSAGGGGGSGGYLKARLYGPYGQFAYVVGPGGTGGAGAGTGGFTGGNGGSGLIIVQEIFQ